ncbi:5-formyltetrahydrofolate cyclo-ligase [Caenibius sp. WL]|uniref:5-formyltetrahydrofolate cyclo-ligase n=1 Tax=Caenibius sp. WL TaxID=2872646 RepID=UPI001C9A06E1|nr:5-formyltetrahydrofolate cyclo-ligase [Caenibius sp. WL]QZP07261.1 5-formyltetrahydrofolate cyclo-ligase [Caenibius sp. WL]
MTGISKDNLRNTLRAQRRKHVAALPNATRALLFLRPPRPVADMVPQGATVGLYRATPHEAPAASYARFFYEAGHTIALPRFSGRGSAMEFAAFTDPFEESDLTPGPYQVLQPNHAAPAVIPDVLFVPLVGFTTEGHRLGQGGGHYDRWFEANPDKIAIGLAWDCQLVDTLPLEAHDHPLAAVVTPTRLYGPF